MARQLYGLDGGAVIQDAAGNILTGRTGDIMNAFSGGAALAGCAAVTGVLGVGGAITQVTTDSRGRVAFWGPDGYTGLVWVDFGDGTRWRFSPADAAAVANAAVTAALSAAGYIPLSAEGVANGVATLDSAGDVLLSQMPDLSALYLSTLLKGAAGGLAELDSTGAVPMDQLPDAVTGAVTAQTTPTPRSILVTWEGNAQATALTPNGVIVGTDHTFTDLMLQAYVPPDSGNLTVVCRARSRADGSNRVLGTANLGPTDRRVIVHFAADAVVPAGDTVFFDVTAVGPTVPGAHISATLVAKGSSLPAIAAAPATPTGFSATGSAGQASLAWTTPSGAIGTHIYRNGLYIASVEGTSSYVDTAVVGGVTYTYTLKSFNDDKVSAATAGQNATISGGTFYDFTQADGPLPGTDWTTTLGSGAGAALDVNGNRMRLQSGNTGGNTANDNVKVQWVKVSAPSAAWTVSGSYVLASTSSALEIYLSADSALAVDYYQLQILSGTYRVGKKVNGGAFVALTGPTARTSAAGTKYWFEFSVNAAGDMALYFWNDGASKPGTPTWSTTAETSRAQIDPGYLLFRELGAASAIAAISYLDDLTIAQA